MPNYYLARHIGIDKEVLDWLISMNSMGVVAFPDPAELAVVSGITASAAEINVLDDAVAGYATASKAVIASAAGLLGGVTLQAGKDAVAGAVHIYPATTANGKALITCANQGGARDVNLTFDANTQATVVHVPDVNLATSYVALSTAALSAAEVDRLDGAGTVAVANKVVIADSDKDISGFRKVWIGVNGSSGYAGELILANGADPGATVTMDYTDLLKLDGITDGTVTAGKAIVPAAGPTINTTSWLPKGSLVLQSLHNYFIPFMEWVTTDMEALGIIEAAGTMYRSSGVFKGELAQNETEVSVIQAAFMIPRSYLSTPGNFKVRCNAKYTAVGGTAGACTVDVEVKKYTPGTGLGADLVTTAAQAITNTAADYDFVVDSSGLDSGNFMIVIVTLSIQETADGGTVQGEVFPYLLLDQCI